MGSSIGDDDISNIWENKKCSKPPTSGLIVGDPTVIRQCLIILIVLAQKWVEIRSKTRDQTILRPSDFENFKWSRLIKGFLVSILQDQKMDGSYSKFWVYSPETLPQVELEAQRPFTKNGTISLSTISIAISPQTLEIKVVVPVVANVGSNRPRPVTPIRRGGISSSSVDWA